MWMIPQHGDKDTLCGLRPSLGPAIHPCCFSGPPPPCLSLQLWCVVIRGRTLG